jgi:hypothetical protein
VKNDENVPSKSTVISRKPDWDVTLFGSPVVSVLHTEESEDGR